MKVIKKRKNKEKFGFKRNIPDEFEHGGIQYFKENLEIDGKFNW